MFLWVGKIDISHGDIEEFYINKFGTKFNNRNSSYHKTYIDYTSHTL